tara:strand:- start:662 stop:1942 length:1281 start_codon:yes stop_codon:yes gene_type:complete
MKKNSYFKHLLVSDLSGVERAKTVWCENGDNSLQTAGWIPSNALITCFGDLAPSKMPEVGDVNLVEISELPVMLNHKEQTSETRFSICAIENLDHTPWACCLRSQLEKAMKRLEKSFGLQLRIGLEQEFYLMDSSREILNAYSLKSFFEEENFLETLAKSLESSGLELKSLHSENGVAQYELTFSPENPLNACDHLVLAKSISRWCAVKMGRMITFSPLISKEKVGSGLHVHFSLCDQDGININEDEKHQISQTAGAFLSGILKHLNALTAFTSPSFISGLRYQPPRWTAYFNNFAIQDRKAAIRQTFLGDGLETFHFEFRTADAAASPYLVLSSLIHAGCNGLDQQISPPKSLMTHELLKEMPEGISRLPITLHESLNKLKMDETLMKSFPDELMQHYLENKYFELKIAEKYEGKELFQLYSQCY